MKKKISDKMITFSVTITGRCNASCEYCHFFKSRNRNDIAFDMDFGLYDIYLDFIKYWKTNISNTVSFRFSGGDPMVIGDRLFELANLGYARTGIRPFILTAGKDLNLKWIKKARDSAIEHIFVSIENPLAPMKGAPNPMVVSSMIKKCSTPEMPVVPGVCVVPNRCFKDLFQICSWFFDQFGRIPVLSEINYESYLRPTEKEFVSLQKSIEEILVKFGSKVHLNMFASVAPEIAYGGKTPCIIELGLRNTHKINRDNLVQKTSEMLSDVEEMYFPKPCCIQKECPWFGSCQIVKRDWMYVDGKIDKEKLTDYCRFKRIISDTYYRFFVDRTHPNTKYSIRFN